MNQVTDGNFMTDNSETVPGSSSDLIPEVMDSNENVVNVVADIQSKYMKNKTENEMPKIQNDKTKEMTVSSQPDKKNLKRKTAHPPNSNIVTEVMDSNANVADDMPDKQSKYTKNKTGNAKSKVLNDKIKEMTVVSQIERINLKRKADHPPTSELMMEPIKAIKQRNGATFEDIRKYMEGKCAVNVKRLKYHAEKFLKKGADNGILEKIDRNGAEERFKMKKSENSKKDVSKKMPRKKGKGRPEKKMAETKQQVKK